jgi:hypothetical protein
VTIWRAAGPGEPLLAFTRMAMAGDADWAWLRAAAEAPEMTIEVYESLPEDLTRGIEVVDGTVIVRHSPSDKHQAV